MLTPRARVTGMVLGIAAATFAGILFLSGSNRPGAGGPDLNSLSGDPVVAPAKALGRAFAAVAKRGRPAVVGIYAEKHVARRGGPFPFPDQFFQQFFGQGGALPGQAPDERVQGMGSGMILDRQGNILTNYHVVADVDRIRVQLADKRHFAARVVSSDPKTDIAVIRIADPVPDDLPTVSLGDSDAPEVGDLVIAIGAPFGLTQTVTHGIISAKGRADVGITAYEDFLQTDAPINPGNSGGPLLNMDGDVIGMNSAIATGGGGQSAGVGFAIPSNMIKRMLPNLIKGGQIVRGSIGVVIRDVDDEVAQQLHLKETAGALVAQVSSRSPAEKAGVRAGDVIVQAGDTPVADTRSLRNVVAGTAPGADLSLQLLRNGQRQTVHVVVATMAPDQRPVPLARTPDNGGW
jgi:serine protease Do